jgi:hypothetical protein
MAKEKSGASPVVLRGSLTQGAANGFIAGTALTGLSAAGNDALIVKSISMEFSSSTFAAVGSVASVELAFSRALKAAMPTILDDDLLYKFKFETVVSAAASPVGAGIVQFVPQVDLVIIEDTVHTMFDSNNMAAVIPVQWNILALPATVTESEKVGLLLSRLN